MGSMIPWRALSLADSPEEKAHRRECIQGIGAPFGKTAATRALSWNFLRFLGVPHREDVSS